MKNGLLVVLVALALGCGSRQKRDEVESAPAVASTEPQRVEQAPAPEPTPVPARPMPGAKPAGLKGILLPPDMPGQARVALQGCLAQPEGSETLGTTFPVAPPSRGPAKPAVEVSALGSGALVVHQLEHGCCLKADVKSSLEGQVVTLTETLSGETCRCRCGSTVRAAIGLESGDYTLRVITVEGGHSKVAHEAALTVR
ncbi:hypothetical protein [Archangium sp.]|jgi:hypothetical protein|uniref:hypothetical protein n=1 Tax=Archangium sp. TaxID=1872627 RepID=UPI002ED9FB2F